MYDYSVNYRAFDTINTIDIHQYLMKKLKIKYVSEKFMYLKKIIFGILPHVVAKMKNI